MATVGLEVTRAIRNRIGDGTYPPRTRLNENELAASLSVSRTPVRNALSVLAAEGLLVYTPNSGYSVRDFTTKDIREIYAVRSMLEGLAARNAALNGLSDAQRGTMHRLLGETGDIIATGRWDGETCDRWRVINRQFHDVIYEASGNEYLALSIRRTDEIPFFGLIRFQWYDANFLQRSHQEHVEIADALFNRQPNRAEALETEHVYRSGRRLIEQWERVERAMAAPAEPAPVK